MVALPHAHSIGVAEGKWTVGTIHAVPDLADDDFIGVLAAAELLGVTNRTIYALIDEGALQAEITEDERSQGPTGHPHSFGCHRRVSRAEPSQPRRAT